MIKRFAEVESDDEIFFAIPGQIIRVEDHDVVVACSEKKIRIKQVEMEGKIVKPASIISSLRQRLN